MKKNTFSDQVFTTFIDLPKAIRIIDDKKYFIENQANIIQIGLLPELYLCNIIWHLAFLVLLNLNSWFYWVISPWFLEFKFWHSTCIVYCFLEWGNILMLFCNYNFYSIPSAYATRLVFIVVNYPIFRFVLLFPLQLYFYVHSK